MIDFDIERKTSIKKTCTLYHKSMIWGQDDVLYMFVVAQTTKFYHLHALFMSDFSM